MIKKQYQVPTLLSLVKTIEAMGLIVKHITNTVEVEFWDTDSVLPEDWVDKGENPGGTEAVLDSWDVWEMEETEGGERFGLRLK